MAIETSLWARYAYDPTPKIDHCTNNLSESFNAWVDPLRGFSVLIICEELRTQIMKRITVRRTKGLRNKPLAMPRVMFKLHEALQQARRCSILSKGKMQFEVQDISFRFVVNLDQKTCDCRRWDITGLPCRHAWTAINHMRLEGQHFISHNHTKAAYHAAYNIVINPIPQHTFWPNDLNNDVCMPPENRRMPGRPQVQRRKPAHEEGGKKHLKTGLRKQYKCRNCGKSGHNKAKCPLLKKSETGQVYISSLSLYLLCF